VRRRGFTLVGLASIVALTGVAVLPAGATAVGPPLRIPVATLQAGLVCSDDLAGATKTPILLVPGTLESTEQAYSWGYHKALRAEGFPVCTVDFPDRGIGDMQTTVEYVVHAVRTMAATSGRKISMIGHSQGGLLEAWALRFWPDLPALVDDAISLSSPYSGTQLANDVVCGLGFCSSLAWQIRRGSDWVKAVGRAPIAAGPSFTSIGSTTDEGVYPAPAATVLSGATNLMFQDLCPGRLVGHATALADAAGYALVMDALTHAGPADLTRTGTSSCGSVTLPGANLLDMTRLIGIIPAAIDFLLEGLTTWSEPPLREYAIREPGDTDLAVGRPATASTTETAALSAAKAVDGDPATRWSSAWWSPQWISVDLGSVRVVDGVRLTWESAYGKGYRIQTSTNGSDWTTQWSTGDGNGGVDTIPISAVSARYVRMYGTDRATFWGFSLFDFSVIGH
jgi:triacylglycerol esterase/lipase EstA (alpha/beta hydrolase family)